MDRLDISNIKNSKYFSNVFIFFDYKCKCRNKKYHFDPIINKNPVTLTCSKYKRPFIVVGGLKSPNAKKLNISIRKGKK